jgi:hypothetical protein
MLQIANEFSDPPPYSLNEFYRGGARVPASANTNIPTDGSISMRSFYGAAAGPGATRVTLNLNINYDTLWYNVEQYATSTVGYIQGLTDINVTVAPEVRVGSTIGIPTSPTPTNPGIFAPGSSSPSLPAAGYPIGNIPGVFGAMMVPVNISNPVGLGAGNKVTINNNGHIVGYGGGGGLGGPQAPAPPGGSGGTALYLSGPITLNLGPGSILGGGGGGGGAGGTLNYVIPRPPKSGGPIATYQSGGTGGQGAGIIGVPTLTGNPQNPFNFATAFGPSSWPTNPAAFTPSPFMPLGTSAYQAGAGSTFFTPVGPTGAGGPGGTLGSAGTAGTPSSYPGGPGGAAGLAISGTSFVDNYPSISPLIGTVIVGPTIAGSRFLDITATGATSVTTTGNYKTAVFNGTGNFTVNAVGWDLTEGQNIWVIMVGGGGSGGSAFAGQQSGGGGGAGGFINSNTTISSVGTYTITVGGASSPTNITPSTGLGTALNAPGGGSGGNAGNQGSSGGSSGGNSGYLPFTVSGATGSPGIYGVAGLYGYPGAQGTGDGSTYYLGGGGGGAGGSGQFSPPVSPKTVQGPSGGGFGLKHSITGSEVYYAIGGSAGSIDGNQQAPPAGPTGGGVGARSPFLESATDGAVNTGSGGGAGAGTGGSYSNGAFGGSGVFIMRWRFQ